jgi:hypothetical protein
VPNDDWLLWQLSRDRRVKSRARSGRKGSHAD